MNTSLRSRLHKATRSIPIRDTEGVHEMNAPGSFQLLSSIALIVGTITLCLTIWLLDGRYALVVTTIAGALSFGGLFLLFWVRPLVKMDNPWELHRWINRHTWFYTILVFGNVVFGLLTP